MDTNCQLFRVVGKVVQVKRVKYVQTVGDHHMCALFNLVTFQQNCFWIVVAVKGKVVAKVAVCLVAVYCFCRINHGYRKTAKCTQDVLLRLLLFLLFFCVGFMRVYCSAASLHLFYNRRLKLRVVEAGGRKVKEWAVRHSNVGTWGEVSTGTYPMLSQVIKFVERRSIPGIYRNNIKLKRFGDIFHVYEGNATVLYLLCWRTRGHAKNVIVFVKENIFQGSNYLLRYKCR